MAPLDLGARLIANPFHSLANKKKKVTWGAHGTLLEQYFFMLVGQDQDSLALAHPMNLVSLALHRFIFYQSKKKKKMSLANSFKTGK